MKTRKVGSADKLWIAGLWGTVCRITRTRSGKIVAREDDDLPESFGEDLTGTRVPHLFEVEGIR